MTFHDEALDVMQAIALLGVILSGAGCARPHASAPAREPGFVRSVESNDGTRCRSRLPLTFTVTRDGLSLAHAALAAAETWNRELGLEAVRPDVEATVLITLGVRPVDAPSRLGLCASRCVGGTLRQEITLYVAGDGEIVDSVLVHELGHALGVRGDADEFGHSTDELSVMFATVGDVRGQRILPADVAAFRRAWGMP